MKSFHIKMGIGSMERSEVAAEIRGFANGGRRGQIAVFND